jgi:hypothetical protein
MECMRHLLFELLLTFVVPYGQGIIDTFYNSADIEI